MSTQVYEEEKWERECIDMDVEELVPCECGFSRWRDRCRRHILTCQVCRDNRERRWFQLLHIDYSCGRG
jgi:hypothetical protein